MKMDKEMMYEVPEVLVLKVAVEAGFENSFDGAGEQAGSWSGEETDI